MKFREKKLFLSKKGSLTLQFLLGFILCLSFVMLFAVMSLTIAVAEITQYITYASARKLFLATGIRENQENAAKIKYDELKGKFSGLFSGSPNSSLKLFEIEDDTELKMGQGLGRNPHFPSSDKDNKLFYGVYTKFIPKILQIKTLWGSTQEDSGFFKTAIGSYLGREPSAQECNNFNKARLKSIVENHGPFNVPQAPDRTEIKNSYENSCRSNRSSSSSLLNISICSDNGC